MQFSLLLQNIYPKEEADSITSLVFEELLKMDASMLRSNKDKLLSSDLIEKFDLILKRLYNHEPVQYVLGVCYFYGLKFLVNENVLIPRRETEELVDLIYKKNTLPAPKVMDIGTGSGCIAIGIKSKLHNASVFAIDINENAVRLARLNAKTILGVNKEEKFIPRDIFDTSWWHTTGTYDIIVSNPPYVTEAEKMEMLPNVLQYEPAQALFVPNNNPLLYYITIADFALQKLNKNGKLYFEINRAFGEKMKDMLIEKGFININIYKDMQGNNRIVEAHIQ